MASIYDRPLKVDGVEVPDGARIGLQYRHTLYYAKYNKVNHSLIWESESLGGETPFHPDYLESHTLMNSNFKIIF